MRPGGRLISIAAEPPQHARSGISAVYFVVEPSREQLTELARLTDDGQLRATIDRTFPLADARNAFERSRERNRRGKIVLRSAGEG